MKWITNALILLGFVTPSATYALSLAEAKQRAFEGSAHLRAMTEELNERRATHRQAISAYYPRIGIAGGAEHRGGDTTGLGYAFAELNVFRGLEDSTRAEMAQTDVSIAELRLERAKFRLSSQIEQLFSKRLFKETAIRLRTEALELNSSHRKMAAVRAGAGISTKSDVMEFDLRESLIRADLALLAQDLEEVHINFKKLIPDFDPRSLERGGALDHLHVKTNWGELSQHVRARAEQAQIASLELRRANLEAGVWRGRWLPEINLEGQWGYLDRESRPQGGGTAVRGLVLAKMDLFDGFRMFAQRDEGTAKRAKAEARYDEALRSSLAEAETIFRRLSTTQLRVDLEENNEQKAQNYYAAVVKEYRRGVKGSGDVRVAADLLYESRLRKHGFMHDFTEQRLELERLIGTSIETEKIVSPN